MRSLHDAITQFATLLISATLMPYQQGSLISCCDCSSVIFKVPEVLHNFNPAGDRWRVHSETLLELFFHTVSGASLFCQFSIQSDIIDVAIVPDFCCVSGSLNGSDLT